MKSKLSQRDRDFLRFYARKRDMELAAAGAGISLVRAKTLLTDPEALKQLEQTAARERRQTMQQSLIQGLDSLRFSPETDLGGLLRLSLDARSGTAPEGPVPLANVSEVKFPKDGGLEIKFFDRGKLLESLCGIAGQEAADAGEGGLISAVENSVRELRQK